MKSADKTKLKNQQHIINDQKKIICSEREENSALRRNIADYKHRHDKAINALANLASGLGRKRDGDHNWDEAMKRLAREELADIAKMPLREGP